MNQNITSLDSKRPMASHPIWAVIRCFGDVQDLLETAAQELDARDPRDQDKIGLFIAVYCRAGRHRSVTIERFIRACLVIELLACLRRAAMIMTMILSPMKFRPMHDDAYDNEVADGIHDDDDDDGDDVLDL